MEDKYSKYLQLSMNIFFVFVGFILALLGLLFALRYIMGVLDYLPWFSYLFTIFIILVPSVLMIAIFSIYFKRSLTHPAVVVKWISLVLFSIAIAGWLYFMLADVLFFFKSGAREVGKYNSYNVFYLSGSVAAIFLVGVIQALSTEKEKDWMQKRREKEALQNPPDIDDAEVF
jgi:hypothetical protein